MPFLIAMLAFATSSFAAEPRPAFWPGELLPDDAGIHVNAHGGGILLHDSVYYWFGEHKVAGKIGNTAQVGVGVYSSRDLYHWKNEGIALAVSDDPASDIVKGCIIERPKVIYNAKTGTFVMWFHLELKGKGYGAARAGLAVADRVTGPYRYVGSWRPNAGVWPVDAAPDLKERQGSPARQWGDNSVVGGSLVRRDFRGGQMSRDMTLFVDDDARGYLLTASEENQTLQLHELSDDYRGFTGRWTRILPGAANEAPAVFKCEGKYYLITSGCTGWKPNDARSAVADSLWGPWKSLGNPCRGTPEQNAKTFESQSTYVLPVAGKPNALIFMADRWRPENPIDGRYVWLPIEWENGVPVLRWHATWDLNFFDTSGVNQKK